VNLVLDASVAAKWFLPEAGSAAALALLEEGSRFCAPDILPLEVASAVLRKERRHEAPAGRGRQALMDLDLIGLDLTPHTGLLRRAAALSGRHRHALYDCLYLVLAQDRALPLATFDRPLAALAERLGIPLCPLDTAP
jgi:predicted nucleic acid-binding protein